jgi:diguanylate cyclase (GGDEF)-like protein
MHQQLLLIDDSKNIHPLVTALLGDEPIDIHSAYDAEYGFTLATSILPDLILLDVEMPGTNGFEACKRLKAEPSTAGIPIIFLTARASVEEKVKGLELGAVDYVTKPCNRAELLARVRASLRTSHLIRLLEEKALIDFLTGLGNRAMFEQRFAAETSRRIRSGAALSCITLDIDNFKETNDRYGHPFGDQVLQKVARCISELCRAEDVACRLGGDEFVVIVPNAAAEPAGRLAERMRLAVAKLEFLQQGLPVHLTCSIGVADAADKYDRTLLTRADEALYESKSKGRNRVTVAATPAVPELQIAAA